MYVVLGVTNKNTLLSKSQRVFPLLVGSKEECEGFVATTPAPKYSKSLYGEYKVLQVGGGEYVDHFVYVG